MPRLNNILAAIVELAEDFIAVNAIDIGVLIRRYITGHDEDPFMLVAALALFVSAAYIMSAEGNGVLEFPEQHIAHIPRGMYFYFTFAAGNFARLALQVLCRRIFDDIRRHARLVAESIRHLNHRGLALLADTLEFFAGQD